MIKDRNISDDAQIAVHKIMGAGRPQRTGTKALYVDGTYGSDGNDGHSPDHAYATIQAAVTAAGAGYTIYVFPKTITDYTGDPTSYAETIIIPYANSNLSLIGVGTGRTQGGLPQIKKGSGTTALLTVRAPGCGIYNIGFNASGSTGGCILLDDDYAAKAAFGTTIHNCHFKNSVNATAATSGGAISWGAAGNAWQVTISDCQFYRNVCDICIIGTSSTVPQDVVIKNCTFSSDAAIADCNIYAGGDGFGGGLIIDNCLFPKQPAKGTTDRFTSITCYGTAGTGIMSNCRFGAAGTTTGYGAAKATAIIGTTIELCGNYSNAGLIVRET
jgi:hypothetical protein